MVLYKIKPKYKDKIFTNISAGIGNLSCFIAF